MESLSVESFWMLTLSLIDDVVFLGAVILGWEPITSAPITEKLDRAKEPSPVGDAPARSSRFPHINISKLDLSHLSSTVLQFCTDSWTRASSWG